jgi:protein ImuA
MVLWCRPARHEAGVPYGPGLAEFGLGPDRLILVDTNKPRETLWAMEEGLRCRHLAAVVGEEATPDLTASRRLQLAAETGGTLGIVLPPARIRPQTSAALTRWKVTALPSKPEAGGPGRPRWNVALMRCRGGGGGEWALEWEHEALRFAVASPLADRPLAATG